jgi:hypothetical protein
VGPESFTVRAPWRAGCEGGGLGAGRGEVRDHLVVLLGGAEAGDMPGGEGDLDLIRLP